MSRFKGTFIFGANFEGGSTVPIDARQLVGTYADLTDPATWCFSPVCSTQAIYDGLFTVVSSDSTPANNGIYWLCDAANYTSASSWIKVGEGSSNLSGATNGLCLFSGNTQVGLGGALSENTTITAGTNNFVIQGSSSASFIDYLYSGGADTFRVKAANGDYVGSILSQATPTLGRLLLRASSGGTSTYASIDMCQTAMVQTLKTTGGTNTLNFANDGTTVFTDNINSKGLEYGDDYSNQYTCLSIPHVGYVTGYTTQFSNTVAVCNVNTTYTATTENDFIGVSGATCIFLPATPKECQRITVVDIEGDALSNSIEINGNGNLINGTACATINTDYGSITFINNNLNGWSAVAFIN